MVFDIIFSLINQYFINPIVNSSGYNLVNTLVYGIILIGVAFGIVYPQLDKRGFKFNFKFALTLLPYIILGITLRILEDQHILLRSPNPLNPWFYTFSPGIWILIGVITIASLLISKKLSKKLNTSFENVFLGIGILFALPLFLFSLTRMIELFAFVSVIALALLITIVIHFASKYFDKFPLNLYKSKMNSLALLSQTLDGSATAISLAFFRCGEQHVVSGWIIDNFTPFGFLVVKIILVSVVLYLLEKEVEDENLKNFMKLFIIILGFATGLRGVFTLGVGTCS